MAGIKIVDLPALGRDLAATDLLELSLAGGTGSRKITGQEIINASKLNVGTTPIINGTAGRLLFQGSGDILQQSSSLFWDSANTRLNAGVFVASSGYPSYMIGGFNAMDYGDGLRIAYSGGSQKITFYTNSGTARLQIPDSGNVLIGTTTDAGFKLDVNGTARVQNDLTLSTGLLNLNSTTRFQGNIINFFSHNRLSSSGTFGWDIRTAGTQNSFWRYNDGSGNTELGSNSYGIAFYGANTLRTTMTSGGNWLINTTTDAGFRLDVNGTARFKDTGSNSSVIIDYATGGYIRVNDASLGEAIRLRAGGGASWFNTGQNLLIGTTTDAGFRLDVNGTARFTGRIDAGSFTPGAGASAYTIATTGRISAGNGISFRSPIVGDSIFVGLSPASGHSQIEIYTSGNRGFVFGGSGGDTSPMANATANFNPSSGTGDKAIFQVSGQYQTSGTYSGAIRGFYYSPTLTSMTGVTAHWAIHTTSGRVRFEGLPTSPTGLNAGDLWNDAGTLKIV